MSGGRKINDHSSWMGKGSNGSVFPMGAKTKSESSAGGAGHLADYEETTEAIKSAQEMGQKKIHAHNRKSDYRN